MPDYATPYGDRSTNGREKRTPKCVTGEVTRKKAELKDDEDAVEPPLSFNSRKKFGAQNFLGKIFPLHIQFKVVQTQEQH